MGGIFTAIFEKIASHLNAYNQPIEAPITTFSSLKLVLRQMALRPLIRVAHIDAGEEIMSS